MFKKFSRSVLIFVTFIKCSSAANHTDSNLEKSEKISLGTVPLSHSQDISGYKLGVVIEGHDGKDILISPSVREYIIKDLRDRGADVFTFTHLIGDDITAGAADDFNFLIPISQEKLERHTSPNRFPNCYAGVPIDSEYSLRMRIEKAYIRSVVFESILASDILFDLIIFIDSNASLHQELRNSEISSAKEGNLWVANYASIGSEDSPIAMANWMISKSLSGEYYYLNWYCRETHWRVVYDAFLANNDIQLKFIGP